MRVCVCVCVYEVLVEIRIIRIVKLLLVFRSQHRVRRPMRRDGYDVLRIDGCCGFRKEKAPILFLTHRARHGNVR